MSCKVFPLVSGRRKYPNRTPDKETLPNRKKVPASPMLPLREGKRATTKNPWDNYLCVCVICNKPNTCTGSKLEVIAHKYDLRSRGYNSLP